MSLRPTPLEQIQRLQARLQRRLYLLARQAHCRLRTRRRLRILFSDLPGWQPFIEQGFRGSPHAVAFSDLAQAPLETFDLVVPLTVPDLLYLDGVRPRLSRSPLPIPSADAVRLCDDKPRLNAALAASGFAAHLPGASRVGEYPYIIKKRQAAGGLDCHLVASPQDEAACAALLDDPAYFCQAFIPGRREFAAHLLLVDGQVRASLNVQYVFTRQAPIKGQDLAYYTTVEPCPHIPLFTAMLNAIGFSGLCCVNYKVDARQILLLEINPRFGGSLGPFFFTFIPALLASRGS